MYKIIDLIEDDHGCEGLMPGEEPMVTLVIEDDNGSVLSVRVRDKKAYELGWDVGAVVSKEELGKYSEH